MRVALLLCTSFLSTAILCSQSFSVPSRPIRLPFQPLTSDTPLAMVLTLANEKVSLRTVIDTGNGVVPLLLSRKAAQLLGLPINNNEVRTVFGVGSGNSPTISPTKLASFGIGDFVVRDFQVGISASLDTLSARAGQSIDANLGYPFLKHFTLTLDFPNREIVLSGQRLSGGVAFTMAAKKPLLILPVKINNQGPFTFALDTGASNSVISPILAQRLGLPRGMNVPMVGASGETTAYFTTVESLTFAGATNRNLTLATGDFFETLSQSTGTRIDGILGFNSFQGLTLTIDYPQGRLSTRP